MSGTRGVVVLEDGWHVAKCPLCRWRGPLRQTLDSATADLRDHQRSSRHRSAREDRLRGEW